VSFPISDPNMENAWAVAAELGLGRANQSHPPLSRFASKSMSMTEEPWDQLSQPIKATPACLAIKDPVVPAPQFRSEPEDSSSSGTSDSDSDASGSSSNSSSSSSNSSSKDANDSGAGSGSGGGSGIQAKKPKSSWSRFRDSAWTMYGRLSSFAEERFTQASNVAPIYSREFLLTGLDTTSTPSTGSGSGRGAASRELLSGEGSPVHILGVQGSPKCGVARVHVSVSADAGAEKQYESFAIGYTAATTIDDLLHYLRVKANDKIRLHGWNKTGQYAVLDMTYATEVQTVLEFVNLTPADTLVCYKAQLHGVDDVQLGFAMNVWQEKDSLSPKAVSVKVTCDPSTPSQPVNHTSPTLDSSRQGLKKRFRDLQASLELEEAALHSHTANLKSIRESMDQMKRAYDSDFTTPKLLCLKFQGGHSPPALMTAKDKPDAVAVPIFTPVVATCDLFRTTSVRPSSDSSDSSDSSYSTSTENTDCANDQGVCIELFASDTDDDDTSAEEPVHILSSSNSAGSDSDEGSSGGRRNGMNSSDSTSSYSDDDSNNDDYHSTDPASDPGSPSVLAVPPNTPAHTQSAFGSGCGQGKVFILSMNLIMICRSASETTIRAGNRLLGERLLYKAQRIFVRVCSAAYRRICVHIRPTRDGKLSGYVCSGRPAPWTWDV
jgi:hypothetical protein